VRLGDAGAPGLQGGEALDPAASSGRGGALTAAAPPADAAPRFFRPPTLFVSLASRRAA
jgi:hypothetical protein